MLVRSELCVASTRAPPVRVLIPRGLYCPGNSLCSQCLLSHPIKFVGFILQGNSKVRHCLRNFFPHHKMFMMERPVAGKDVAQLEMLRDDQLQLRFRQQEEAFCQHIWKEAPVKMLLNNSPVTGRSEQW